MGRNRDNTANIRNDGPKLITARDIAAEVGVAISTVGRALADDPRISARTKALVRKAAEQVGYAGNTPARVMRGGASNLVGLILPDVRNDFYSEIAQALSETCDRAGHRLVLAITGDDRDVEARHIRELTSARASGVIIVPTASPRRESIKMLRGLPHVQLLRHLSAIGNIWFGINDEPALLEATQHLIALGHRRIAYLGGEESHSTGAARLRGFRRACVALGNSRELVTESLGPTTAAFGAFATERLLGLPKPPTAIVTGSVHITLGLIEAVERLGVEVPERVSVIGFGDPVWFQWWHGGLTTIRPPVQELATTCGLWFLHNLSAKKPPDTWTGHHSVANSQLLVRATAKRAEAVAARRTSARV